MQYNTYDLYNTYISWVQNWSNIIITNIFIKIISLCVNIYIKAGAKLRVYLGFKSVKFSLDLPNMYAIIHCTRHPAKEDLEFGTHTHRSAFKSMSVYTHTCSHSHVHTDPLYLL